MLHARKALDPAPRWRPLNPQDRRGAEVGGIELRATYTHMRGLCEPAFASGQALMTGTRPLRPRDVGPEAGGPGAGRVQAAGDREDRAGGWGGGGSAGVAG